MMDKFTFQLILCGIGDILIWFGIYFLCARSHIRRAEENNEEPDLKRLRICFIVSWLIIHSFFVWLGIEVTKWGGPD